MYVYSACRQCVLGCPEMCWFVFCCYLKNDCSPDVSATWGTASRRGARSADPSFSGSETASSYQLHKGQQPIKSQFMDSRSDVRADREKIISGAEEFLQVWLSCARTFILETMLSQLQAQVNMDWGK